MAKLTEPPGKTKLTPEQIEACMLIPVWDKYSLANPEPPEQIDSEEVQKRYAGGYIRTAYIHLTRVILKVRDDLWYETTDKEFDTAVRTFEENKRNSKRAGRSGRHDPRSGGY